MFARVFLYAIIGLIALQIIKSLFRPRLPTDKPRRRSPQRGPSEEILVRDPHCGVYLPRTTGLKRRVRGEEHYFCSQECFETFRAGREA